MSLLLAKPPVIAAWTLIAHASAGAGGINGSTPVPAVTPPIDTTGANLLIVNGGAYYYDQAPPIDLHDNMGNTFTGAIFEYGGFVAGQCFMWYTYNPVVGPNHIFTYAAWVGGVTVAAFAGASASPLGQTNSNYSNASNQLSISPGPITPVSNNVLIFTGVTNQNQEDLIDSGFTVIDTVPWVEGMTLSQSGAYLTQPVAATVSPTWSWAQPDSVSAAVIASFHHS